MARAGSHEPRWWALSIRPSPTISLFLCGKSTPVSAGSSDYNGAMPHPTPHVFVTQGDLTKLACDAWMLPTDQGLSVKAHWRESVPSLSARLDSLIDPGFSGGTVLASVLPEGEPGEPSVVVAAVPYLGIFDSEGIELAMQAVRAFVACGAQVERQRDASSRMASRRGFPLLALPAFGTEGGGGHAIRGELLRRLLAVLQGESVKHKVDVALVVRDAAMFGLLQRLRKEDVVRSWPSITPEVFDRVRGLATFARSGRLVPFMGSGVSVSAGGPTWRELLRALASEAGADQAMVESLLSGGHGPLDQASIIRLLYLERSPDHPAGDGGFSAAVARCVNLTRYGLTPLLLASLRTEQAITLNYDTVFESASQDVGLARTVIPDYGDNEGALAVESSAWLLKLHGSVDNPESIVLTRDDYLGYSTQREALSAIVKANLITHHLFLVGFGFADDHFHQSLHDVTRALPGRGQQRLGTAISVGTDEFTERLWGDRLNLVSLDGDDVARSGRELEIILDALLALSGDEHQYLLQEGFESGLNDSELSLKAKILALQGAVSLEEKDTAAWKLVEQLLGDLGGH